MPRPRSTVTKVCQYCGKEFSSPRWRVENQRYCCKSCASRAVPRGFKKGRIPWNKGLNGVQVVSGETKRKMSLAHLGMKYNMTEKGSKAIAESAMKTLKENPEIHRRGGISASKINPYFGEGHMPTYGNLGKTFDEGWREKLSKSHLGLPSGMKGKTMSPEAIEKIRIARLNQVIPEKDTTIEIIVQRKLSDKSVPCKTHIPIGHYQVDILLSSKKIIECYGCYWHACRLCGFSNLEIENYDMGRLHYLQRLGYTVHVLWEHEIRNENLLNQKLEEILK